MNATPTFGSSVRKWIYKRLQFFSLVQNNRSTFFLYLLLTSRFSRIHKYPNVEQHLPFLNCLAAKDTSGPFNESICPCVFQQCALESHLWFPAIKVCHDEKAWEMLQAADQATPEHDQVPWIVVDGQRVELPSDLVRAVCEVYQENGGTYPACAQPPVQVEAVPTCPRPFDFSMSTSDSS